MFHDSFPRWEKILDAVSGPAEAIVHAATSWPSLELKLGRDWESPGGQREFEGRLVRQRAEAEFQGRLQVAR